MSSPLIDRISDGEEVEFGMDGWMTNPRFIDSDTDGVSDRNEIIGNAPCGSATDPTRADTDDDGYDDNVDRYMGDAVLRITLMEYKTLDTINGQDNVPVFFVINYQDQGQEFATKRVSATKNVLYALNWIYDVDIPETATYVNVEFEAVAENAGWLGDDAQLDLDQDDSNKYNAYWTISSTPFIGTGTDSGGSYDAYLKVKMERAVAEKAKVIVINGTGEDGDYGLDLVTTGIYRYSADDQMYLVVLNVTGTSAHFQSGMNAIILPRAISLQCQLNDTLYDLQNVTNTPFSGASFYSTDPLKTTASGHIITVISKNVTASQAEVILTMLTHNPTGDRIGNNVTISSTALYLLHLPSDILSAIPTSVMNSGMGEGPNYYSLGSVIGDITGMVFDFLVWVATGGVLLLLAHLVKEGLKAISNLISTAITAVEAAVDRIIDAFCAMVDWAIELIQGTIDSLMNGMIGGLQQLGNSFCGQAHISCNAAAIDYNTTGVVSQEQINKIAAALIGTFFISLLTLGCVIITALIILSVVTNVFSFLIGLVVSTLLTFIVVELFMSTISYLQGDDPLDSLTTFLSSFITNQGGDPEDQYLSAAVDAVIGVFDIMAVGVLKVSLPGGYDKFPKALAASVSGLVMAIYADTMTSGFGGLLLGVLGLELSFYGLLESFKGLRTPGLDSNSKIAYGFTGLVSLVGTGKAALDVWGSVQELGNAN